MTAALPALFAVGLALVLMQKQSAPAQTRDTRETQFAQYLVLLGASLGTSVASLGQAMNAIRAKHPTTAGNLNTFYYSMVSEYSKNLGTTDAELMRVRLATDITQLGEALLESPAKFQAQTTALKNAGMNNTVATLLSAYYGALQEIK